MTEPTRDKTERRLKKTKIALMRNPKFALWSGIMMVGKTTLDDDFPTACTNGRDETYGRKFVESLNDKELAFVMLHENMHKAFRHLTIWKRLFKENPQCANQACDYVINLMLVNNDPQQQYIAMPQKDGKNHGCLDARFANMNTKQVFEILKKEQKEGKGGGGDGFDQHDWDGADELTKEEKLELEREIDQALRQGQIAHNKAVGKEKGGGEFDIGELLKPKINWKEQLAEFVKSICNAKDASSWRRVNRRFIAQDILMPTMIGEKIGKIVIGMDTSGSVGEVELRAGMTEIKSIIDMVRPAGIELIYWGTDVVGHETYDETTMETLVQYTRPISGGGTQPRSMQEYLKTHNIKAECIIQLTDGCIGDWGDDWGAPILWVVCGDYGKGITAPVGKTIHIDLD